MDSLGLCWLALLCYSRFAHIYMTASFPSLHFVILSEALVYTIFIGMQTFTFSPKKSTDFQLVMRFVQGVLSIGLLTALVLVVHFTSLTVADLFSSILAFIPTGWLFLSVSFLIHKFYHVHTLYIHFSHDVTIKA